MTTLSSSEYSSHRPTFAEYKRLVYSQDGWGPMQRWNGSDTSVVAAGFTGPAVTSGSWAPTPTTAAGSSIVGSHVFRYRYKDSTTGYVSNPSEEVAITIVSTQEALTFPISTTGAANIIRSTDSKVDTIILEATVAAGSEFFAATEVANSASSIVFDIDDAELEALLLPYPEDGHDPPPISKYVVSHRSHLWLFGQVTHTTGDLDFTNGSANVSEGTVSPDLSAEALGDSTASPVTEKSVQWFIQKDGDSQIYEIDYYDESASYIVLKENYAGTSEVDANYKIFSSSNVIWVSNPGYPEGFNPLKFINGPNGERAGDVTAGTGFGSSMIFFGEGSMFQLIWSVDPLSTTNPPIQVPVSDKYGALNQNTVIEVEGVVYALDRSGIQAFDGTFPKHISNPVDDLWDDMYFTSAENWSTIFIPSIRSIRWFYTTGSDTYPKNYLQLDIDTKTWGTGEYKQGISAVRLIPTGGGVRPMAGDENGHLWFLDEEFSDGAKGHTHQTVNGTATTTVLPIVDSPLPTSGVGLQGVVVKWVSGDEYSVITANGTNNFTVSPAFSSVPASGDELWLGPIPCKLKSRQISPQSFVYKLSPNKFVVAFKPISSSRTLLFRSFDNFGSAQRYVESSGNDLKGLTRPAATTGDWEVDLTYSEGVVEVPLGGEFRTDITLELECEEPDVDLEIAGFEVDYVQRRSHQ